MVRYRIGRDWFFSHRYAVQVWRLWWPFWVEYTGLLTSKEEALIVINDLKKVYK